MRRRRRQQESGTVAGLVSAFRASPRYAAWGPTTRRKFERILVDFGDKNGALALDQITRGTLKRAINEITVTRGPGAAASWLKVMRGLFDYALDLEWIAADPTHGIRTPPPANADGHRTWRDDEIDRFRAHHHVGSVARRTMEVLFCTGSARADAVRLGAFNLRGDQIEYRRQKSGTVATMPILPELARVLDGLAPDRPWLSTRDNRPRSEKSLTGDMARWVAAAGLPAGLGCHGLRKARGRVLAEAGASPHMIMAWLGHATLKEAARYSAAYDRAQASRKAAELLGNAPRKTVRRLPVKR